MNQDTLELIGKLDVLASALAGERDSAAASLGTAPADFKRALGVLNSQRTELKRALVTFQIAYLNLGIEADVLLPTQFKALAKTGGTADPKQFLAMLKAGGSQGSGAAKVKKLHAKLQASIKDLDAARESAEKVLRAQVSVFTKIISSSRPVAGQPQRPLPVGLEDLFHWRLPKPPTPSSSYSGPVIGPDL